MALNQLSSQPQSTPQVPDREEILGPKVNAAIEAVVSASQDPDNLGAAVNNALSEMVNSKLITAEQAKELASADTATFLQLARQISQDAYLLRKDDLIEAALALKTVGACKLSIDYRNK